MGSLALVGAAALWMLAKRRPRDWLPQLVAPMRQCLGDLRTVIVVTAITCTSWGVVAFSWQVFLYSGGLHLGFAKSAALMSVVTSIGIVSLVPGGLGVTEATAAQLLTRVGFAPATAQAGSILLRAGSLVAIALAAGHLALWKLVRSRRHRRTPSM
jgi:uncharacterized membrane protein YbhN (UPF0104 family)